MNYTKIKLTLQVLIFGFSLNATAQQGYNEQEQLRKINIELGKYYDGNNSNKYFYKLTRIENDTLYVQKFSYSHVNKNIHTWKELYVPMNQVDLKKVKYKKGILFRTKGKKEVVGNSLNPSNPMNKNFLKIHPQAGESKDKEIMEMLVTLFKNH